MADKLCLLVCESLEREVKAVVESERFDDVVVRVFPAHCGHPQMGWKAWRAIIYACERDYSQVYLLGSSCIAGLQPPPDELKHCRLHKMDGCYNLFAGKGMAEAHLKTSAYLLVPGWLAHWKRHIDEWGFDQATAHEFFAKSADRLVLLDTGIDTASANHLTEFAGFVGLPCASVLVGLDFSRMFLTKIVLEWRLQNERYKAEESLARRQWAEGALRQLNRDLDLLGRVSQTLTATLDSREVTERLMKVLTQTIGAEGSSVWLWNEEKPGGLVCRGAAYPGMKRPLVNLRLGSEVGIAGWVAHHKESAIVPDVSSDPRFSPIIDIQIGFHTVCVLAVPLRVHDKVIGVLEAVNKVSGDFDAHDCALLETLASSAAIAIENARLVENLRQQTAELSVRNEELDAFAHTVAHDLKNPLYMLIGFSDLLSDAHIAMTDRERQECYRGIARVAYKMDSIVKELLLLAQVRQVDVETKPLNMAGILAEVQQRLASMIAEYRAEVVAPTAWPTAMGHASWIEEVWVNYLSNALKYGGRPPRIELGAAPLADSPPFAGEGKSGSMVRFWVRDNGAGIASEDQARLFVPFTRLSPARVGGHGLGLSIVRRIVEKLGGQVGVESQLGHGSVFSFTLPGASSPPDTSPGESG
jgi:signal transduction histidine kinase